MSSAISDATLVQDEPVETAIAPRPTHAMRQEIADETALPLLSVEHMTKAVEAYQALQRKLDQLMPDAIMEIEGRKFRKRTYWRAIAVAFGLTVEPVSERRESAGEFDDGHENFGYLIVYRASTRSGRSVIGDGSCFAVEKARRFKCPHEDPQKKGWKLHFPPEQCPDYDERYQWRVLPQQATEHNIRSHASTRAYNRAVSNLVGFGEVSAEEMVRDERDPRAEHESAAPADGKCYVVEAVRSTGTNKNGREWERFAVKLSDGRSGSTFDTDLGYTAQVLQQAGMPVEATFEQSGKYQNLVTIREASAAKPVTMNGDETLLIATEEAPPEPVLLTTVRELKRNGKVLYGLKSTQGPECYTDIASVAEYARGCAKEARPVVLLTELRDVNGQPVLWVLELLAATPAVVTAR